MLAERFAEGITRYSRAVVVVMLVATLVIGSAAGDVDSDIDIAAFASDSTAAQKLDYVRNNFTTAGENTTTVQVVFRDGDALSRDSLLAGLRLQRALLANETINATLADRPFIGLSNLVAVAAIRHERVPDVGGNGSTLLLEPGSGPGQPTPPSDRGTADRRSSGHARWPSLAAQIDQLKGMTDAEVAAVVYRLLATDARIPGDADPYALLPTDHEPGSSQADARVLLVRQDSPGEELSTAVVDAQLAIRDLADRVGGDSRRDVFAFGAGIVNAEATAATGDSFAVITPFAFLLVVAVLLFAYRDPLDVLLGLLGVVLVLVWMGGFMGWVGIGVTQILIAVPFLLVGLSIDYALHVVMRYREARADGAASPREGMARGLAGVAVALGATSFTTAVGFFSNYGSPIRSIREFGLVSAAGIVSAFLVFAVLLPALKLELEAGLERLGLDRDRVAFGRAGAAGRLLGVGTRLARVAPVAVLVVGLVLAGAGGAAATDVETSIQQVDFLPRETPGWMASLPGGLAPGEYHVRTDAVYLDDTFLQARERAQVQLLVEGDVAAPGTLDRLATGRRAVANTSTAVVLADAEPRVTGPLSVVRTVAARNETFAAVVASADTDGDGIPDRNLRRVYDALYRVAPERARSVIHREDDRYRALRLQVAVRAGADSGTITSEFRDVAATIEAEGAGGSGATPTGSDPAASDLRVTATGQPVVQEVVQQGLLRTLVQGFVLTLLVILAFLTAIFRRRHGTLALGAVTLVPVVFALAWILGTMYLLGIPFNTETAIITSIAIGLGVDYAIHVSERFVQEFAGDPYAALDRTLAGTGGALLASATSTAAGFGVLTISLVPSLQRFGLVSGLTIVYALVASVVVLPSLLVLWTRYAVGEAAALDTEPPTDGR